MTTKRAKTLTIEQLSALLSYTAQTSRNPLRDYCIVLLSYKAGLRAAEIAGLDWNDVTDATGAVVKTLFVPGDIAKKGHDRHVPVHSALFATLCELRKTAIAQGVAGPNDPIIRGVKSPRMSPNAICLYLERLYAKAGFQG